MSQEQLAEKLGVSRQAVTKWETDTGIPDIENIMEQSEVDKMAKAIEDAIAALEKKPASTKPGTSDKSPQTGDTSNLALWIALLFVSGGAAIGTTVVSRKKKYNR